jgi:U4/U6.U5 tri-snRNP-associated protein 1
LRFHWITIVCLTTSTLTLEPLEITSDYADPSTIKIKKPKKRKNKQNTATSAGAILGDSILPEDTPNGETTDIIPGPSTKSFARTAKSEDTGTADDEELQELLAQRRRQAMKKRKIARPEEFIQQYRMEEDEEMGDIAQTGGLLIDDTSEFVRGIELARAESGRAASEERKPSIQDMHDVEEVPDEIADIEMETSDEIKEEATDGVPTAEPDEPAIGTSLAATFAALKRRGEIQTDKSRFKSEELQKREEIHLRQRQRQAEAEAESRRQKEAERNAERFNRMSNKEREKWREEQAQQREKREAMNRMQEFKEYKFNVNLEYKDEFGEEMTPKDAFKRLSHAFHGKASGTMKRGKYLQKVQTQKKQAAGTSSIADVEKVNAQREKQKQMGSAFARIQ